MAATGLTPEQGTTDYVVSLLLAASRHRSRTVQQMPCDERGPARYEVIDTAGDYVAIIELCPDGMLRLRATGDAAAAASRLPAWVRCRP